MSKRIHVLICENEQLTKDLIQQHFFPGRLSAAYSFSPLSRDDITAALDKVLDADVGRDEETHGSGVRSDMGTL